MTSPLFYSASTGSPKSGSRSSDTVIGNKAACFISRNHYSYGARTDFPGAGCHLFLSSTDWVLRATAYDQGSATCQAACV